VLSGAATSTSNPTSTTVTTTNSSKRRGLGLQLKRDSVGAGNEVETAVEQALMDGVLTSPIRVRIGVHGGMVNVGNMGCIQRLSYTALGDAVNTASRLEGFVKQMEGPCEVVCGATLVDEAHPALIARYIGPVRLVGKRDAIDVCQMLGAALLNVDEVAALQQRTTIHHHRNNHHAHHRGSLVSLGPERECGGDADRAVTNYLAACGLQRALDAHVLNVVAAFNERARNVHLQAAAAQRPTVIMLAPHGCAGGATPDVASGTTSTNPLHSAAVLGPIACVQPEILKAVDLLEQAYLDLPQELQALFAIEDSLQCVRSGTGAIECSRK
jgi:hypothetical protein